MAQQGMFNAALALLLFLIYFLPTIIAGFSGKRNGWAIFALNFFLGFTFIGWIIALVWALTKDSVQVEIK
ncbi:MAG: superinfection immunity protein [bacterium]|nr:superinfection immunity protein [bacterium]